MNTSNKIGPPAKLAFPHRIDFIGPDNDPFTGKSIPAGHTEVYIDTGMTLRDYFAAKAMQGAAASSVAYSSEKEAAADAYAMADAMLAERDK